VSKERDRIYDTEEVARVGQMIRDFVPHNRALGIEVVRIRMTEVWTRLPWAPHLVGDPVRGILHGGVISTLTDATCGLAIMARLGRPSSIATLDLRIDYLKPAPPHAEVYAWASCFRVTKSVCFVRGGAVTVLPPEGSPPGLDDAIAAVAGTFARKSG
jgi:uncharacterized protein (TIGR00369 family)